MSLERLVSTNEPLIRMGFFFGVFAPVTVWELASPRCVLKRGPRQRWTANLGIVLLNTVIVRLSFLGLRMGWPR